MSPIIQFMLLFIIIVVVLYILIQLYDYFLSENFSMYQTYQAVAPSSSFFSPIPWWNGYTNFPWWNTPLGTTKNMSYDLRGDPLVIPRTQFVWNNSSLFPIYNKSI